MLAELSFGGTTLGFYFSHASILSLDQDLFQDFKHDQLQDDFLMRIHVVTKTMLQADGSNIVFENLLPA